MRKTVYFTIAFLIFALGLSIFISSSQTGMPLLASQNPSNQEMPEAVITNAPYPGWDYFLFYLKSNGTIWATQYETQQQTTQDLLDCGIVGTNQSVMSVAIPCLFPQAASQGEGVLNATSYSNLSALVLHAGAYYVDSSTNPPTIRVRAGWVNCANPNYGNGTNGCN